MHPVKNQHRSDARRVISPRRGILPGVIKSPTLLDELNARAEREEFRTLTYDRAADIFAQLWQEAQRLNPDAGAALVAELRNR